MHTEDKTENICEWMDCVARMSLMEQRNKHESSIRSQEDQFILQLTLASFPSLHTAGHCLRSNSLVAASIAGSKFKVGDDMTPFPAPEDH